MMHRAEWREGDEDRVLTQISVKHCHSGGHLEFQVHHVDPTQLRCTENT